MKSDPYNQIARDHGIVTSMLFRWRANLGFGKGKHANLAAVKTAEEQSGAARSTRSVAAGHGMTAVELGDNRRVFAPEGSDPETARRHVADRETAR
jgi:transposase-like protein